MSKRVYKFTSADHGISNLLNTRLKLSTIDDLNDPFDLCPIDTTDPVISNAMDAVITHFRQTTAILCFSRNWDNLLLWSHYGASHTGICLGFDIPDSSLGANYDTDVLYQPNLLQILRPEDVNFDLVSRSLRTKHESWSYEQEVRMFVGLNDPPDASGLRWIEFGPNLVLKEIIIGAQCHPKVSKEVEDAVKKYGHSVKCSWAGMRPDAFLLVKQDHPPHWHASVK
ncbi:MAG TPA: hypothetical protein DEQ47_02580 [Solibacterales bacterium]|nr:hypothetical protein [Bryobacterales bacterium]